MLNTSTRPLNEFDRRCLSDYTHRAGLWRSRGGEGCVIGCWVFFTVPVIAALHTFVDSLIIGGIIPWAITIAVAAWFYYMFRFKFMKPVASDLTFMVRVQKDLDANEAQIIHVHAHGAVRLLQQETTMPEGLDFFLDIGDGQLMYIYGGALTELVFGEKYRTWLAQGLTLNELEKRGVFPNTKFNIHRAPHCGVIFNIECLGERFDPERTIDPNAIGTDLSNLPDGTIFSGTLDALEESVARYIESLQEKEQTEE